MWSTGDIQKMFGVSPQTVRNWTKEFKTFLSDGASPIRSGYTRSFTADDLRVFALVVEMTHIGATYNEVRDALKEGRRGDLPEVPEEESDLTALLSPQEIARTLSLMKERDEAIGRIEQLLVERENDKKIIDEKDKDINRLNREIGRLEAQLEAMRKGADDD